MINNISWQSYWTFIALTVALYYLIIVSFFYKAEIKALISKGITSRSSIVNHDDSSIVSLNMEPSKDKTNLKYQSFVDELEAFFEALVNETVSKEYLIASIHTLIRKHAIVTYIEQKELVALQQLIQFLSKDKCSIHLSADDVTGMWEG